MTNYIKLFHSKKPLTENHPVQSGFITINEPLLAGNYEFGLFNKVSKKGNNYLGGIIKEVYQKKEVAKPFNEVDDNEEILF